MLSAFFNWFGYNTISETKWKLKYLTKWAKSSTTIHPCKHHRIIILILHNDAPNVSSKDMRGWTRWAFATNFVHPVFNWNFSNDFQNFGIWFFGLCKQIVGWFNFNFSFLITEFNIKFWQGHVQIDHRNKILSNGSFGNFFTKDAEAYNFSQKIWELTSTKSIELHNKLFS